MTNFTQKQTAYIEGRAAGLKKKAAAEAAGYSPATAEAQANNMERRADIKNAILRAKRNIKSSGVASDAPADDLEDDSKNRMPKAKYDDAMEFLKDAMNHPGIPIAARADYAKALLPYQHARIGEKGKKASEKEAAQSLAAGAKRSKFAKKSPPREHRMSVN